MRTPDPKLRHDRPPVSNYASLMQRILLTGMSGVGKSTVTGHLAARGYAAVDLDDPAWSEWVDSPDGDGPSADEAGKDWVWREDRLTKLLATDQRDPLFLSGCAANMGQFTGRFDTVVLLTAPAAVMAERLRHRTTNAYGKRPEELARSLELKATVEPLLRSIAHLEIDTTAPLDEVVAGVLALAGS